MAVEMSGSAPGSPRYLGFYQKAMKLVDEGLDEETRVKYRAEAKKWAEKTVPPQEQQRYGHTKSFHQTGIDLISPRMFGKHAINTMQDFSETVYRQYGVRVVILGGYCDDDGPSIMLCV
jgi:hypothetical protein